MEENNNNFTNKINDLYKNLSYLDKYGGSLFVSGVVLIVFFFILSFFYVMHNIEPIKKNWLLYRCSPSVIPFAGIINKDNNSTVFDFTKQNFYGCVSSILELVAKEAIKPITYISMLAQNAVLGVVHNVQSIREKVNNVANNFASIDNVIMNRIFSVLLPLRYMFIKIKDTIDRVKGTLLTSLYTILGGYLSIRSLLKQITTWLIAGLAVLAAFIILMAALFFGFPIALMLLPVFVAVSIPTILIITELSHIVNMNSTVPSKPSISRRCFDGETKIKMINGSFKDIKDIRPNELLFNGSLVTAKFILDASGQDMYNYNNTIVSGSHSIFINGKMKLVKDLEDAIIIDNYDKPFIYCINTDNKIIKINDDIFADWDEISEGEMYTLFKNAGKTFMKQNSSFFSSNKTFTKKDIHKFFDGGFVENTRVILENGKTKLLKDIIIGDKLINGDTVYGLVEITTNNINVYKSSLQDIQIIGAPNIELLNKTLGHFSHLDPKSELIKREHKPCRLLHLLTNSGRIVINGMCSFYDYNGCLDIILKLHPNDEKFKNKMKKEIDSAYESNGFKKFFGL